MVLPPFPLPVAAITEAVLLPLLLNPPVAPFELLPPTPPFPPDEDILKLGIPDSREAVEESMIA
jgi:hypothetical protein